MRVLAHDHSGHPFQVQLSRELARRGHEVLHIHAATFETPKGPLGRLDGDPPNIEIEGLSHGSEFRKYEFARRAAQELRYAQFFNRRAKRFAPDVMIVCNTPVISQFAITRRAAREGVGIVLWLQDVYSVAFADAARERGRVVRAAAPLVERLERDALRRSDVIVAISEDYVPPLTQWGIRRDAIEIVPNWAPLEDLPAFPKNNGWARDHGLAEPFVFLYTGTLGLKHNTELLLALAERWRGDRSVRLVVVSQGPGADWVRAQAVNRELTNVDVLPFQSAEEYAGVLGAADVLLAVLHDEAGRYSVPSKILSYHCAARPILAAMPHDNQAARLIESIGSGLVVRPGDVPGFVDAAVRLRSSTSEREVFSARARHYAEKAFDVGAITDLFEGFLVRAAHGPGGHPA